MLLVGASSALKVFQVTSKSRLNFKSITRKIMTRRSIQIRDSCPRSVMRDHNLVFVMFFLSAELLQSTIKANVNDVCTRKLCRFLCARTRSQWSLFKENERHRRRVPLPLARSTRCNCMLPPPSPSFLLGHIPAQGGIYTEVEQFHTTFLISSIDS